VETISVIKLSNWKHVKVSNIVYIYSYQSMVLKCLLLIVDVSVWVSSSL